MDERKGRVGPWMCVGREHFRLVGGEWEVHSEPHPTERMSEGAADVDERKEVAESRSACLDREV